MSTFGRSDVSDEAICLQPFEVFRYGTAINSKGCCHSGCGNVRIIEDERDNLITRFLSTFSVHFFRFLSTFFLKRSMQ